MNIPQVPLKLVYYEYNDDNNNSKSIRNASKFSRNVKENKIVQA